MKPIWQRLRERKLWAKFLEIEALILILVGAVLMLRGVFVRTPIAGSAGPLM